jgi:hypothetical protein
MARDHEGRTAAEDARRLALTIQQAVVKFETEHPDHEVVGIEQEPPRLMGAGREWKLLVVLKGSRTGPR